MKVKELKEIINRYPGRRDWLKIYEGLDLVCITKSESISLDLLDEWEIDWIAPDMTDKGVRDIGETGPCIKIVLKERREETT